MITQELLREWLRYDPDTGVFTWAKSRDRGKVQEGRKAGCLHRDGYYKIRLLDELCRCARLAVLYMTGEMPDFVDHINGDRGDDRWANLRRCSKSQNQFNRSKQVNNKSGIKGVFWNTNRDRWQVKVAAYGRQHHGGFFTSLDEARLSAQALTERLHGEFTRLE